MVFAGMSSNNKRGLGCVVVIALQAAAVVCVRRRSRRAAAHWTAAVPSAGPKRCRQVLLLLLLLLLVMGVRGCVHVVATIASAIIIFRPAPNTPLRPHFLFAGACWAGWTWWRRGSRQ